MYTPVASRKEETPITPSGGYTPVAQRTPAPTVAPFDPTFKTPSPPPAFPSFSQPQTTARSTPSTNSGGTIQDIVKESAQAVPRTALSFTVDIYNALTRKDPTKFKESLSPDDFGVTPDFLEKITGVKEIKPLASQIAEKTPEIKGWQDSLPSSDTPDLSVREKIVLDTLKNINPEKLAFAGVIGGAGLDLSLFGGGEKTALKGLYKVIAKETNPGNLLILGKRMGVVDDLLETFVEGGLKANNEKSAKLFMDNFVNLQRTTKQSGVYKSVAERVVTDVADVQEIKNSIEEGRLTLRTGEFDGRKLSPEELLLVRKSVENDLAKIGESKISNKEMPSYSVETISSDDIFNKKTDPLIQEAKKYKSVEEFKSNITPKQYREILNEEFGDFGKGAGEKMTGATKRKYGDYLYSQDREMFNAQLSDVQKGINPHEHEFINELYNQATQKTAKQLPPPEGLPKLPTQTIEQKTISPVDQFIAEGKIRVKSVNNRDVYEYKKGNNWQRARDEDSAVKAVTPVQKPVNFALEKKKLELEFKKDALAEHPAQGLSKYVAKSGEFAGELPEVLGTTDSLKGVRGNARKFMKRGDDIVNEKGFADSEQARESLNDFKKRSEEVENLKAEVKELSKSEPISEKVPEIRLKGAEAQSLEESAQQMLDTVDEPFVKEVSPLSKMVTDTNTPVKEKVGALDFFRTPDRVLTKIGLGDVAKQLRISYDNYVKELPVHLDIITEWSKEVSKESNQKIFKWLDGQKITLDAKEMKVAGEIKKYLEEWAFRLGLPEDNRITHYITHIFDLGTNAKEFDEDIARLIKDKVPGSVYDPFLEKRLGKKGYIEDTWQALDAYTKRAVRKSNMDPALEQLKRASVHLEEGQLNYVTKLGARINMRPTEWDTLLDNTIKQLVGYRFGQRPTAVISGTLRKMVYRGALGLNINSAIKNLTQGVNTFAKLGVRDTLLGYINLLKPGMTKELDEVGILRNGFIQDRTLSATKQMLQKADKGLFVMFELAEKINRGSAYFGAKASAIRKGLSEEQAIAMAKKMVRDTQFQFGSIDTPLAMQGDIAKTLFQFGSFSQKQTEFLTEMAKKKEWAGIVRYILASMAIVYTAGQVFNIKAQDFNPLNYFARFGKPPSLALPISVIKAVTNMPDQYGKTPTTKAKIKDIIYSGTTLVPAGIQLKKFLNGEIIGGNKPAKKKEDPKSKTLKTPTGLPKLPSLKKKLPSPAGLPKLP